MYNAYITEIKDLRKHSNADRLQCCDIFGNSVIVDLKYKNGDKIIYFPTDGQLGYEYAEKNNLLRKKDENGNSVGGYLDPNKRNVTTLKLRGEKSDGLVMPIESLKDFCDISKLKIGDTISVLNGITICQKYVPCTTQQNGNTNNGNKSNKSKFKPKSHYPLFEEHIDTSQLAYNLQQFKQGDICQITLKIHGTSGRTAHTIKETTENNFLKRLFHIKGKNIKTWEYVSGTRRTVLTSQNKGFYGDNDFRQKYHDFFVGKLNKGEEVFYEIVGWVKENQLIMPECDNEKTKDKEFIKQYGKTTKFTYGCENGENQIYVYRMTLTNEDGFTIEYTPEQIKSRCEQMGINTVVEFDRFVFTTTEDLLSRVNVLVEGVDPIGKNHIKEGVVVRILNRNNFAVYKHKSFNFKVLEGICKAEAVVADMEESQDNLTCSLG